MLVNSRVPRDWFAPRVDHISLISAHQLLIVLHLFSFGWSTQAGLAWRMLTSTAASSEVVMWQHGQRCRLKLAFVSPLFKSVCIFLLSSHLQSFDSGTSYSQNYTRHTCHANNGLFSGWYWAVWPCFRYLFGNENRPLRRVPWKKKIMDSFPLVVSVHLFPRIFLKQFLGTLHHLTSISFAFGNSEIYG
jgi:hypothetical protein